MVLILIGSVLVVLSAAGFATLYGIELIDDMIKAVGRFSDD